MDSIKKIVYIDKYSWKVICYFVADNSLIYDILYQLKKIGCSGNFYQRAKRNLKLNRIDSGFTYSNKYLRQSIIVIERTYTAVEFLNSFVHELRHLSDDIAKASRIELDGEDVAYLSGGIAKQMYYTIKPLLNDNF